MHCTALHCTARRYTTGLTLYCSSAQWEHSNTVQGRTVQYSAGNTPEWLTYPRHWVLTRAHNDGTLLTYCIHNNPIEYGGILFIRPKYSYIYISSSLLKNIKKSCLQQIALFIQWSLSVCLPKSINDSIYITWLSDFLYFSTFSFFCALV